MISKFVTWYDGACCLMFLTGNGIKTRTHACKEHCTFPNQVNHQNLGALGLRSCASHALMMHLVGKCAISAWAWVLAIIPRMSGYCKRSDIIVPVHLMPLYWPTFTLLASFTPKLALLSTKVGLSKHVIRVEYKFFFWIWINFPSILPLNTGITHEWLYYI